jgi:hypothetical protein
MLRPYGPEIFSQDLRSGIISPRHSIKGCWGLMMCWAQAPKKTGSAAHTQSIAVETRQAVEALKRFTAVLQGRLA